VLASILNARGKVNRVGIGRGAMVKGRIGVKEGVWRRETQKEVVGIRKLERMEKAEEVKGVDKEKEKVLEERDGIKEEMKMMKEEKDNLMREIEGIKKVKEIG
jgi:hypothetical protein